MVKGKLAAILTRMANHSLVSNTWKSYDSCFKSIAKMEKELGFRLSAPIDKTMVLTVLAILIKRA